jgi:hypothetical protein
MAAFTLTQAQTQLTAWMNAELTIANGAQEYSIGGRAFKRGDLAQIAQRILYWQRMVDRLSRSPVGARIRQVIPI